MSTVPARMTAVLLTGHGGLDRLEVRDDVPVPEPARGEVLIRVAAAGINNTDVNTRVGWYSKTVTGPTEAGGVAGFAGAERADAGWTGEPIRFPRIQGADCCGRVVGIGEGVDPRRLGERVVVRPLFTPPGRSDPHELWTLGSERDGAFAQFTTVPAAEAYRVESDWTDAELASLPCAYSTAENLLQRAAVAAGEHVLVTGASGGVGSAAVQLAARRGARVTALAAADKAAGVAALGAGRVLPREADLHPELDGDRLDAVIDVVGGPALPRLLELLRPGGRCAVAGAIAGPLVELDLRTLYLGDLTLLGCTRQERAVFERLLGYVERNEIAPLVARIYPLAEIAAAQTDFLAKRYLGKLVLLPPG